MKKLIFLAITLVLFYIQNTILMRFPINGVTIPLFYTFALISAIYADEWDAIFLGLLTGFLVDIYSPNLFGLNMFINMNFFLGARLLSDYLRKDRKIVVLFLTTLISALSYGFGYLVYSISGYVARPMNILTSIVIIMVLTIPMIYFVKWVFNIPMIKRVNRMY